jgi:hypothetical protein
MKILLDIGVSKTGSKARQLFFCNELHRVISARAFYVRAGREGLWHQPLYFSLEKGDQSSLRGVVQEVEESAGTRDLAIISYETMFMLGEEQIRWLAESFRDLTVLVFLRRQDQLVNSRRHHKHKAHRLSFEKLVEFEAEMLGHDPDFDYRNILERWVGALGRRAVVPIRYDKSTSSVVAFFRNAGVEVKLDGHIEAHPNRAMDARGLEVLRWVKRLVPDARELLDIMSDVHQALEARVVPYDAGVERYSLTMEMRRHVMDTYKATNEWVRHEFFPDLPSLFSDLEPGEFFHISDSNGRALAESILAEIRARRSRTKGSPD